MISLISKVVSAVLKPIFEVLNNIMYEAFETLLSHLFYAVTCILTNLVQDLYYIFEGVSGERLVQWGKGNYGHLIDFFVRNESIRGIYWGMVAIGVVLVFVFALIATARKIFDLGDKMQNQSLGSILWGCAKSIFIMISLTAMLVVSLDIVNLLIEKVDDVFNKGSALVEKTDIVFTDEQFATMARIFNTIGDYSVNPGYDHRYNLNSCYNDLREDLLLLQQQGVFDFNYPYTDSSGSATLNWQNVLQLLVNVRDPELPVTMDTYDSQLFETLKDIMEVLEKGGDFYPLKEYHLPHTETAEEIHLDRILYLSGTLEAARNSAYNKNPSLNDGVRGPFYRGEKSIYRIDQVESSFYVSFVSYRYLLVWILCFFMAKNMIIAIWNATARIVNVVALYIIAPPIAATIPMDNGEKFKQWTMSMVIQMLGIFGVIVPMRLVFLFVPMILNPDFILVEDYILTNLIGKDLMIIGMMFAMSKFGSVFTGILANNAGMAAISAGDIGESAMGETLGNLKSAYSIGKSLMGKDKGKGGGEGGDKGGEGGEGGDKGGEGGGKGGGDKLPSSQAGKGGGKSGGGSGGGPKSAPGGKKPGGNGSTLPKKASAPGEGGGKGGGDKLPSSQAGKGGGEGGGNNGGNGGEGGGNNGGNGGEGGGFGEVGGENGGEGGGFGEVGGENGGEGGDFGEVGGENPNDLPQNEGEGGFSDDELDDFNDDDGDFGGGDDSGDDGDFGLNSLFDQDGGGYGGGNEGSNPNDNSDIPVDNLVDSVNVKAGMNDNPQVSNTSNSSSGQNKAAPPSNPGSGVGPSANVENTIGKIKKGN